MTPGFPIRPQLSSDDCAATASKILPGFALGPATVLVARFKVADAGEFKSTSVRAFSVIVLSRTGERIRIDTRQRTLKIQDASCAGDLNGDGNVTVGDLVGLLSGITGAVELAPCSSQ